jgi:uncharacterized damage-inducible protein DinB
MTHHSYRPGPVGSLADVYETTLTEFKRFLSVIPEDRFAEILNPGVEEDFRSVRNIVAHVVRSGYVYADHIRKRFGEKSGQHDFSIDAVAGGIAELEKMFHYTLDTLEGKWHLTDDDLLEALLEHAIVHVMRHRRQIGKLLHMARR